MECSVVCRVDPCVAIESPRSDSSGTISTARKRVITPDGTGEWNEVFLIAVERVGLDR